MPIFKKFPIGTAAITIAILIAYVALSSDTPYITDSNLEHFALNPANPLSVVTHLFVHVGVLHLLGNLLPLILFGIAVESVAMPLDVVAIFLISGSIAALLFSLTNPGISLMGASAGISGLLSASMLLKPKKALVLLIITPLLVSAILYPLADLGTKTFVQAANVEKTSKVTELNNAIAQGKPMEVIQNINKTVQRADEKIQNTQNGKEREAATPTDFMVHIYGALVGAFYVYSLKRNRMKAAENEFVEIGEFFYKQVDRFSGWLRRR